MKSSTGGLARAPLPHSPLESTTCKLDNPSNIVYILLQPPALPAMLYSVTVGLRDDDAAEWASSTRSHTLATASPSLTPLSDSANHPLEHSHSASETTQPLNRTMSSPGQLAGDQVYLGTYLLDRLAQLDVKCLFGVPGDVRTRFPPPTRAYRTHSLSRPAVQPHLPRPRRRAPRSPVDRQLQRAQRSLRSGRIRARQAGADQLDSRGRAGRVQARSCDDAWREGQNAGWREGIGRAVDDVWRGRVVGRQRNRCVRWASRADGGIALRHPAVVP